MDVDDDKHTTTRSEAEMIQLEAITEHDELTDVDQIRLHTSRNGKATHDGENGHVSSKLLYGRIKFGGSRDDYHDISEHTAEFVKISATTKPEEVLEFMRDRWGIKTPEVLIAVTGGANDFPLKGNCREFFRRKLIGKALKTGAWIVSGGTYCGVMQHVGEAVQAYGQRASMTSSGVTIGIATWNTLYNKADMMTHLREHAITSDFVYNVMERKSLPKCTSCLDPNHSHFILVDSGKDEFGGEVNFRNDFINYLSKQTRVKFNVCVLLEGGFQSLKTVQIAASVGTPVVVIGGTGRLAKLLSEVFDAYAMQKSWREMVVREADNILTVARKYLNHEAVVDLVKKSLEHHSKFSFCRIGHDPNMQDKILGALLRDSKAGWKIQLRLALIWNSPGIARDILKDEDHDSWAPDDLFPFFIEAVCDNKVHFVKLFLEHRVTVYGLLTLETVNEIYSRVEEHLFLHVLLESKNAGGRSSDTNPAHAVLKHYLKEGYHAFRIDDGIFSDPFLELFFYSVLQNQLQMVEIFWAYTKEPLVAALAATSVLQAISSSRRNQQKFPDECEDIDKSAKRMEELTVGLLDECRDDNQRNTNLMLKATRQNRGSKMSSSCFRIGLSGNAKLGFASHNSVQNILDEMWHGEITLFNYGIKISMATFFPLLLLRHDFIKFNVEDDDDIEVEERMKTRMRKRHENKFESAEDLTDGTNEYSKFRTPDEDLRTNSSSDEKEGSTENQLPFREKLVRFYTRTPLVKFRLHWASYTIFLLYMSYVMLSQFRAEVNVYEMILIIWVASFLCEELRQVSNTDGAFPNKLWVYINDAWNIMDLTAQGLFWLGIVFRCFPSILLDAARIALCSSLVVFCFKLLHVFLRFKKIGPKLLMIRRMLLDMLLFLGIMAVFLLAYGVASQALLYPNLSTSLGDAIPKLLLRSYFQIYGELFLDDIDPADCTHNMTLIASGQTPCPSNRWTGIILLGGYMLISNVLLLNLLIAMFSYTFEQVQENTDALWKYHRYELIREYENKPFVVPPFSILYYLLTIILCIFRVNYTYNNPPVPLTRSLKRWEKLMLEYYLAKLHKESEGNVRIQLKHQRERFDRLENLILSLQGNEMAPITPRYRYSFSM